ncbi:unnamed protein product [Cylicocyclus nassatus]|uniref:Uncharacterized protein n=1 Tax=Cylicocyclus nassatus TaxID=53992 RepID=A0AA36GQX8_CYLNA|nr:unnamed protein product [Cylicocyclus nassatus]
MALVSLFSLEHTSLEGNHHNSTLWHVRRRILRLHSSLPRPHLLVPWFSQLARSGFVNRDMPGMSPRLISIMNYVKSNDLDFLRRTSHAESPSSS